MAETQLLKSLAATLDRLGVPYMLTGSLASSLYGEPRATHDIDVVVDLNSEQIPVLASEFREPDFYLSNQAASEAVASRGMFNAIDLRHGDKIDFWLLTADPFDQERFTRRRCVDFDGVPLWVSTAEDIIVVKLRWNRDSGGSERQQRDALQVYLLQQRLLDLPYIERWINKLALDAQWQQLLAGAR